MNLKYVALVAASAVIFSACSASAPAPSPSPETMVTASPMASLEKTIGLEEQNASEQSGVAVISEGPEGNAVVTLSLSGGTFVEAQPAHIHVGSCPTPGAVKYPLNDVVAGSSVTTLDASYEDVATATEKMAINIHKSAKDSKVYTACGDVN